VNTPARRLQGVMRGMVLSDPHLERRNTPKSRRSSASSGPLCDTNFDHSATHKMPDGESKQDKQATQVQARQVIDVFHEISTLLVCPSVASKWMGFELIHDIERRPRQTDIVYLHIAD
jgi:hypothetical protein